MSDQDRTPGQPTDTEIRTRTWDVAVVGSGLGGGTLGWDLARRGRSVIFLERGYVQKPGLDFMSQKDSAVAALMEGWWPADLSHHDRAEIKMFRHPLGCGTGGSSGIFGMMMERFRPTDFEPRRYLPDAGDSTVPDRWPVGYADLKPYYLEAERLYRVRGTTDPLFHDSSECLPPPPATSKELVLLDAIAKSGLHPYRFHYACERVPECDGCPGKICPRQCRNESHRLCIVPAIEKCGASLLSEYRVDHLESQGRMVEEVVGIRRGAELRVKARVVVLAANTFSTPLILLRSKNVRFPDGLANGSGMVGRNLMLHVSDFLLVKRRGFSLARFKGLGDSMRHGISVNDFYHIDGVKHGNVHAHPIRVSQEAVEAFIRMKYPRRARQFPMLARLAARVGAVIHAEKTYFATIVEDLPYADNRVLPEASNGDRIAYNYTIRDELRKRATTLVRLFATAIARHCSVTTMGSLCQLNRSHACGTVRFGTDPRTSVLDATNRAHEVDNLYVVDGSFFPSSGGINPGLTIAANALRVAKTIAARL